MGAFKPSHWVVLIVIVILVFGANRLPGIAKSVGQSMKVFKKEVKELRDDDDQPQGQLQKPQEGTYFTEPTQPGQTSSQQTPEGSSRQ